MAKLLWVVGAIAAGALWVYALAELWVPDIFGGAHSADRATVLILASATLTIVLMATFGRVFPDRWPDDR